MITFIDCAKTIRLLSTTDNRTRGDRKRERRHILKLYMQNKGYWN